MHDPFEIDALTTCPFLISHARLGSRVRTQVVVTTQRTGLQHLAAGLETGVYSLERRAGGPSGLACRTVDRFVRQLSGPI